MPQNSPWKRAGHCDCLAKASMGVDKKVWRCCNQTVELGRSGPDNDDIAAQNGRICCESDDAIRCGFCQTIKSIGVAQAVNGRSAYLCPGIVKAIEQNANAIQPDIRIAAMQPERRTHQFQRTARNALCFVRHAGSG